MSHTAKQAALAAARQEPTTRDVVETAMDRSKINKRDSWKTLFKDVRAKQWGEKLKKCVR